MISVEGGPFMPRNRIRRWSSLLALLVLASLFGAAVGGMTVRAAPIFDVGQTDIVISEFRTRGPNGANDEFVEIFNPTSTAIDISNWKINGSNNTGGIVTRFTIPAGTTLQPGEHFLIADSTAPGYNGAVTPDGFYGTSIADNGGIALTSR
jgi:hypothetical protein